jgi:hypothetical protein
LVPSLDGAATIKCGFLIKGKLCQHASPNGSTIDLTVEGARRFLGVLFLRGNVLPVSFTYLRRCLYLLPNTLPGIC